MVWLHFDGFLSYCLVIYNLLQRYLQQTIKMSSEPAIDTIDAQGENVELDYDKETSKGEIAVKVICLGDSAVGKSK